MTLEPSAVALKTSIYTRSRLFYFVLNFVTVSSHTECFRLSFSLDQSWYCDFLLIYTKVNMSENSSCDTDDVSDYGDEIPPDIVVAAKKVSLNLLPDKSKRVYAST